MIPKKRNKKLRGAMSIKLKDGREFRGVIVPTDQEEFIILRTEKREI